VVSRRYYARRSVSSDAELLERWRSGDARSGSELFERHFRSLSRFFASKVGDEIDDVLQSTFLACVEGRHRIREGASFRAYLFAIARHELFHHFGKQHRRPEPIDVSVASIAELDASPSQFAAAQGEDRLLLEGLRRLPLELQIALELYYFERIRAPQLAEVLGLPEGTVRTRLRRGLELLRERLAELVGGHARADTTMSNLDDWAEQIRRAVLEREPAER
jgi:RNA polymerase sigma factor (sigma-70 family)